MLISLKEYKLLCFGKTTFYPGKFKIIVSKQKIDNLKSGAILHENGYFNKLWLNTEFNDYSKPSHINLVYAKLKGLNFNTITDRNWSTAKLNATADLIYNAASVVVLSPTELCCVFNTRQFNNLDYLLSTQNNLVYQYAFNINRKDGFNALDKLKDLVNKGEPQNSDGQKPKEHKCCGNCQGNCTHSNVYLDPQVAEHTDPKFLEPQEE